jgi:glycosyltransferase involved in cell wall biosynthesis
MIGQLGHGGSERQLYHFLSQCDRSRWAPVVYVSGELGFWEGPIRELRIPVHLLTGTQLHKLRAFRSLVLAQGASCFFSWSSYTNGFGLALTGRKIRRIGSFRNALFADLPERFRTLWSWWSLAGATTFVCNSRETQRQLNARVGQSKATFFVPNAVEIFPPELVQQWRREWRARLAVGEEDVLVLGVGRLVRQKRFDRFVEVIAAAKPHVSVRSVIVGADLGCGEMIRRLVRDLGLSDVVQVIGPVPDARELICAADTFLLTSDFEGTPNVLLEAMAAGVPCVTTNVDGVCDLIEPEVTGYVGPKLALPLTEYIVRLAQNPQLRRKIGQRARHAAEMSHRPAEIARQMWALCE